MTAQPSLSAQIDQYGQACADHRAGTVDTAVLAAIERLAPSQVRWSMETGCGKTTILLSNLSEHHHVFAYDDREHEGSSIAYYEGCTLFRPERTTTILGATQLTLPVYPFTEPIDLAILDGPHGYPFPELEYFYVYPKLRTGSLLVIDDIHIPTIHRLHTFLAEDEMFSLVHIERTTSFFVRTAAPVFFQLGDGWEFQRFNKARFPVSLDQPAPPPPPVSPGPDPRVAELEHLLAATERELAWWKTAAEARRLKRRLARHLGDWSFLR